jgi:hypothetical protein
MVEVIDDGLVTLRVTGWEYELIGDAVEFMYNRQSLELSTAILLNGPARAREFLGDEYDELRHNVAELRELARSLGRRID